MTLQITPMNEAAAYQVLHWRYDAPYNIYDLVIRPSDTEIVIQFFLDPENAYYRIDNEQGELLAFCCFGLDAQVEGGDYMAPALDLGMGVRPDLTGNGMGIHFANAVIDFARQMFAPSAYRVTIAGFNGRAMRVWEKAGFHLTQHFPAANGRPFVVMVREQV